MTGGIGLRGVSGIDFFEKTGNRRGRKSGKCPKKLSNGSRKLFLGSRDLGVDQNGAANPMECLPDPKTAIKGSKTARIPEYPEKSGFSYFSCRSLLVPIGPGVGSAAWRSLLSKTAWTGVAEPRVIQGLMTGGSCGRFPSSLPPLPVLNHSRRW